MLIPRVVRQGGVVAPEDIKQIVKKSARVGIETFRWAGILGLLTYAAIKTPGSSKVVNDLFRLAGKQPTPVCSSSLENQKTLSGSSVDMFVSQYRDYGKIEQAIKEAGIKTEDLDLNSNNTLFDESIEIKTLISKLRAANSDKYKDEIILLKEIDVASQMLWGKSGPNPYDLIQAGRSNCQVMADIQSLLLTPEGPQILKSKVTVTEFNLSKENLKLSVNVKLNDGTVPISFEIIKEWMSPKEIIPSHVKGNQLYLPIFTYALNKASVPYGGIPSWLPSSTAILLTEESHSTPLTTSLSDEELIELFSNANQSLTKITTSNIKFNNPQLEDIKKDLSEFLEWFTQEERYTYSEEKAKQFIETTRKLAEEITSEGNSHSPQNTFSAPKLIMLASLTTPAIPEITNQLSPRKASKEEDLLPTHVYTVKGCKKVDGEHIVTIIDSQGAEFDLTMKQIRNHAFAIIAKSDKIPNIGSEGLIAILIGAGGIAVIRFGSNKLNRLINPKYKTWVERAMSLILSKHL
ncbi:MAG: hypothetical protein A3I68_07555 [Candidatus Melainabacteria bacterium RIFCSPLOWO2_02_FULL_35_15]|nr:MAG: hypothetical protein A3I68_07555 [Candidatus Melainabacteria bacterium RIFCSPLOWO2_02_FULL_35_15]